jgi:outer membrane protein OmpA-like peptidoglycan-associated protein
MTVAHKLYLLIICAVASFPSFAQNTRGTGLDYLSFAQGMIFVSASSSDPNLKISAAQALASVDGNYGSFSLTPQPVTAEASISFTYLLPALTTFTNFRVPNIFETPSPSQTFIQQVSIFGSSQSATDGFELIASVTLQAHTEKHQFTEFLANSIAKVRWIKLELSGGLKIERDKTYYQFTEIIGHGQQETVALSKTFTGKWKGRGVLLDLKQEGTVVTGCYDKRGDLSGTVSGNTLRAIGIGRDDGVQSIFVLSVDQQGGIDGVRSTNGAPFRRYVGGVAAPDLVTSCNQPAPTTLGCGSTVYGINFDYDSAVIRASSAQVIEQLFGGLTKEDSLSIIIEGHTSSEGSNVYNQQLSERRAQALVDRLVSKGIEKKRISAMGLGEAHSIADNRDEAGRAINRRVKVSCN